MRVNFDDLATHHATRADAAVIRTLRPGLTVVLGESERATVESHERVFLLDAVDHPVRLVLRGRRGTGRARVGGVRLASGGEIHLAHHDDVASTADRIFAPIDGLQHAVRRLASRLLGR